MKSTFTVFLYILLAKYSLSASLSLQGQSQRDSDMFSEMKRQGITYGTALGHKDKDDNKYAAQRDEAFNKLFGKRTIDNSRQRYETEPSEDQSFSPQREQNGFMLAYKKSLKRQPFTFGTALGHKQDKDNKNYVDSLNAKFNELFGKGK